MARSARKIDRKSLKQDPLLNFTTRATQYVNANATMVLGVGAAIVVGIVLLVMWGRGQSTKTETSDILAVQAIGLFTNGQFQPALDQSNAIRTQYPGSRGAAIAAYVRGKSQLQLGVFVDAERAFRDYLNESGKEPFYEDAAKRGLAASLEGQRRFAEAGQLYEDLAADSPEELVDPTLLDAARAYELAGLSDRAKGALERVIAKDGTQSRAARIQLSALEVALNAVGEGRVPEPEALPAGSAPADDAPTEGADATPPQTDAKPTP